jgi:hypothetical protein
MSLLPYIDDTHSASFLIGSTSCFKYATSCDRPLAHVVNISGRYDMDDNTAPANLPENNKRLQDQVRNLFAPFPFFNQTRDACNYISSLLLGILFMVLFEKRNCSGIKGDKEGC